MLVEHHCHSYPHVTVRAAHDFVGLLPGGTFQFLRIGVTIDPAE